jgi:hypothetical protein
MEPARAAVACRSNILQTEAIEPGNASVVAMKGNSTVVAGASSWILIV